MTKNEVLSSLNLSSDFDLLNYLPCKYEILKPTPAKFFDEYEDKEKTCFVVTINNIKTINKANIIRFEGTTPDNLKYNFMIFNQMFYGNIIESNKTFFVVSYYSKKQKSFMVSSIYKLDSQYVIAGVKPIYKLPKKISQSYFISLIDKLLKSHISAYIKDEVPSDLVYKYKLMDRFSALKSVHQPKSTKDLYQALRVFKYEESLRYCIKIESNKRYLALKKKLNTSIINELDIDRFISFLPFRLTKDQKIAVSEIINDMNSDRVMYRLLQGDVSTGKTIVAFLSMYANYLRNGQSVMFAPTTALVSQHYKNALDIFKNTGINIRCLLSKTPQKERTAILNELKSGKCNFLFTTLSGISESVTYKNLSLTIIDEQQNFGVEQRSEMISKGTAVDTLMMSATPIPKTLNKIKNGDMSLSELKQYPNSAKRDIHTKVVKSSNPLIGKAIQKALGKNRQVFVVVPRIDDLDETKSDRTSAIEVYNEYKEIYGDDKVQLLNGRMKINEQTKILNNFINNIKPILITTSVIEVGIDIKEAGLMIIYSANYFGLSSLHQLRGRIGRNGKFSLAILVYDGNDSKAKEKLEFLAENSDGFSIAEYDFKTRGAGSLSSNQQWGDPDLFVANFSNDINIFSSALNDAQIILDNLNNVKEYKEYVEKILKSESIKNMLIA